MSLLVQYWPAALIGALVALALLYLLLRPRQPGHQRGAVDKVMAIVVPGQGTWETTLQARNLDGDTTTDAFYDTALSITWLRNANVNSQTT